MRRQHFQPRFHSATPIEGDVIELTGTEHQHMTKVLRMKAGDRVTLFDGTGIECEAEIREVDRRSAQLAVLTRQEVDRELPFHLTLAVALPKGDRQQWLVEKCVELGVTRLTPLVTERGVAQPNDKALDRLKRWIISASKQCRRNHLLRVTSPASIEQFAAQRSDCTKLIAHPSDDAPLLAQRLASLAQQPTIAVLVGPEGGFSNDEVKKAQSCGCECVSLGPRIMRIETAAIAIAAGLTLGRQS